MLLASQIVVDYLRNNSPSFRCTVKRTDGQLNVLNRSRSRKRHLPPSRSPVNKLRTASAKVKYGAQSAQKYKSVHTIRHNYPC